MSKRRSQKEHDDLVSSVAKHLELNDFRDIKADIEGYSTPDEINWQGDPSGHIPDATGQGKNFVLFEVETSDSINHEHTVDQWRLFDAYAGQNSNTSFIVAVPKGSKNKAEIRIAELVLDNTEVEEI